MGRMAAPNKTTAAPRGANDQRDATECAVFPGRCRTAAGVTAAGVRALEQLPDPELMTALEARRGRGPDEYPVRGLWRAR